MEREAFEKLYETYYMRVYSYVMTRLESQYGRRQREVAASDGLHRCGYCFDYYRYYKRRQKRNGSLKCCRYSLTVNSNVI